MNNYQFHDHNTPSSQEVPDHTDNHTSTDDYLKMLGIDTSAPEAKPTLSAQERIELEDQDYAKHQSSWVENPLYKTSIMALICGLGAIGLYFFANLFFSPLKSNSPSAQQPLPIIDDIATQEEAQSHSSSRLEGKIKSEKAICDLKKDLEINVLLFKF